MANNNSIYNAVLSGVSGAAQARWITNQSASYYADFANKVDKVAIAVDALIPAGTISLGQSDLMTQIVMGVFTGRFPDSTSYVAIAKAIVALWTQLNTKLLPSSGEGAAYYQTIKTQEGLIPQQPVLFLGPSFSGANNAGLSASFVDLLDGGIPVSKLGIGTGAEGQFLGIQGGAYVARTIDSPIADGSITLDKLSTLDVTEGTNIKFSNGSWGSEFGSDWPETVDVPDAGAVTIDFQYQGPFHSITLTQNTILTCARPDRSEIVILRIIQGGAGGFSAAIADFNGYVALPLTTAGAQSIIMGYAGPDQILMISQVGRA